MLPPESVPARAWTPGVRMSKRSTSASASRSITSAPDLAAPPVGRLSDPLEHEVDRDRQPGDDPLAEAVVGDVAQPELLALGDAQRADRGTEIAKLAVGQPALAADRLGQRALAVAVDAGDAEHLAEVQRQRDVVDPGLGALAPSGRVDELERDLGGLCRGAPVTLGLEMELGQLRSGRPPRRTSACTISVSSSSGELERTLLAVDRAGHAALAKDRDAVAERDGLVQLVGDEYDREPVFLSRRSTF